MVMTGGDFMADNSFLHRWDYLEKGVEQIMSRLREGVTMETVSGGTLPLTRCRLC